MPGSELGAFLGIAYLICMPALSGESVCCCFHFTGDSANGLKVILLTVMKSEFKYRGSEFRAYSLNSHTYQLS